MRDVKSIQETVRPIAKAYGIKRVYLFGSYAKGTATEDSDVDLLIETGTKLTLLDLSGLRQDVSELLNLSVDIVTTGALDNDFSESIRDSEVLIYEEQG